MGIAARLSKVERVIEPERDQLAAYVEAERFLAMADDDGEGVSEGEILELARGRWAAKDKILCHEAALEELLTERPDRED